MEDREIEQAKSHSCSSYLNSLGVSSDSKRSKGRYTFFLSPLRDERTASFVVNENRNTWFDYGVGIGGDSISLVMKLENMSFVDAINYLNNTTAISYCSPKKEKSEIEIIRSMEIESRPLISYLESRKIDISVARKFCREIHFSLKGKTQYAIGFGNDGGGYELRNKFLKIATSPKTITTINPNKDTINLFEGFIDFLSVLSHFEIKELESTTIVLNSASMVGSVNHLPYKKKYFWGDNDSAGDNVFSKLEGFSDMRMLYKDYKDFNDFSCKKTKL